MSVERIETLVIGGGHAGLAMSHHLAQRGAEHLVLERGNVGERWRSERWDTLHFQSPNWNMNLPGWPRMTIDPDADPDAYSPLREVTRYLERYSGSERRTGSSPDSLRLTETRWFVREHGEMPASVWKLPAVKSASNCAACHTGAEQGDFRHHNIRIPR